MSESDHETLPSSPLMDELSSPEPLISRKRSRCPEDEKRRVAKLEERRKKNRESAERSRQKKIAYAKNLETENEELVQQVKTLTAEQRSHEKIFLEATRLHQEDIQRLQNEISALRQKVYELGGTLPEQSPELSNLLPKIQESEESKPQKLVIDIEPVPAFEDDSELMDLADYAPEYFDDCDNLFDLDDISPESKVFEKKNGALLFKRLRTLAGNRKPLQMDIISKSEMKLSSKVVDTQCA